jgi:hypothetical protein
VSDTDLTLEARIRSSLTAGIAQRLRVAASAPAARRLAMGSGTLWAPARTPEVADRLGRLTIAERTLAVPELLANSTRQAGPRRTA